MYQDKIVIRGAKEHNLKNVDITLPRFKLVVLTGVSGSGKSSLAFDTLYAEGQRRYVESLSAYARQFIGQMEKPKVDFIGGLSPAIAIEQRAVSKNPRSTVATVTEIYDYLRVLFARVGIPHCPQCGRQVHAQSAQEIVDRVASLPAGADRKEAAAKSKEELYGRPGLYRLFNQIPNRFREKFGTTQCREITAAWQDQWLCREHALHCREIITETAGIAAALALGEREELASKPFGANVENLED